MFFRRRTFMRTILLLLLIGIFVTVAGRWSYDAGWTSGYAAAQTRAESEDGETAAPTPSPRAYPYRSWGFGPIGWFFGGLFKFFLFFLLFGFGLKLLGVLFGLGHWRRHKHKGWHHRHKGRHHPSWHGPDHGDDPYEKSPKDLEPDVRSF